MAYPLPQVAIEINHHLVFMLFMTVWTSYIEFWLVKGKRDIIW